MMGTHPWETMSRGVVFVNKSLIMIIKYEMHFSELSKNVLGGEYQRCQIFFGHDFILESLLDIVLHSIKNPPTTWDDTLLIATQYFFISFCFA